MPRPSKIQLNREDRTLTLQFPDATFVLPAELLRVLSPSAEVRGHGAEEPKLVSGKINVGIETVEAAGRYALKIVFDDGHDTGLYTWDYLYQMGRDQDQLWAEYQRRLEAAGAGRDPDVGVVRFV